MENWSWNLKKKEKKHKSTKNCTDWQCFIGIENCCNSGCKGKLITKSFSQWKGMPPPPLPFQDIIIQMWNFWLDKVTLWSFYRFVQIRRQIWSGLVWSNLIFQTSMSLQTVLRKSNTPYLNSSPFWRWFATSLCIFGHWPFHWHYRKFNFFAYNTITFIRSGYWRRSI